MFRVDARESLLDSAVRLFSERGVAGATVAEIASRADVTAAMVHYYFKNRDQLIDAVAAERLAPIATRIWAPIMDAKEVGPMLAGVAQRVVDAAVANIWLPSLWLREVVSEGGQLRRRLLKTFRPEYLQHLIRTVGAAQKKGNVNRDLDPRLLFSSVLGLTLLPLASRALFEQLPVVGGIRAQDISRHALALLGSVFAERPPRRPETR